MDTTRTKNVTRLAAEFVVIVVGVLTALAVDQIMERRQEHDLERELLLGFVENLRTDSIDYARLPEVANGRAAAAEIRSAFERDNGSLVAALRYMQSRSLGQVGIAGRLSGHASALRQAIREELAY